ncbi:MAG TPA: hypothetical protein VGM90_23750 [Kofleriaceae bacterium]|jgi:hypothetical protein
MSTSQKSNPESGDSPPTGSEDKDGSAEPVEAKAESDDKGDKPAKAAKPLRIELEVSRQRSVGWTVFSVLFGLLLVWKLGTVGVWVGILMVVLGIFRAFELFQTYRHAPGTFEVTDSKVVVPRGLCIGKPVVCTPADVTAVYFLRRSVPWNRSAPVLVVEIGKAAFAFPRDWFASEADQRHIVHALLRGASTDGKVPPKSTPHHDDNSTIMWAQLVGGIALLGAGLAAWSMASTPITNVQYAMFLTPAITGWMFAWRGLMRW